MRGSRYTYLILVAVFATVASLSSAMPTPTEQIKETIDAAIEALKDLGIDQESRKEKVSTLIRKRFDFRAMSKRTLAANWKKANPDQQERFVNLFANILENSYMDRIESYTDEQVEYVKERIKEDRALVDTVIVTGSADIPIRYKMLLEGEEWFVYDVVIEEVSLIRNFRSSYRDIVIKEGMDGLLARMEEKVEEGKQGKEPGRKK